MSELPRDLQLRVVACFDMDMRIRFGLIGRLTLPPHLAAALSDVVQKAPRRVDWVRVGRDCVRQCVPGWYSSYFEHTLDATGTWTRLWMFSSGALAYSN
jgi:hypothetical protein